MSGKTISEETKLLRGYGIINLDEPWSYKPWIQVRELSSGNGRRHIVHDPKWPQRLVHLMSDLEKSVFLRLRSNEDVIEIFEQYPLSKVKTLHVAKKLGFLHPRSPEDGSAITMTTDFLVLVKVFQGMEWKAFAVKTKEELKDKRVLEKLKIEQQYWLQKNIEWNIITEENL